MVVYLIQSEDKYQALVSNLDTKAYALWLTKTAFSQTVRHDLESTDIEFSVFDYDIDTQEELEGAIQTIAEHHPGQEIVSEFSFCS